MGFYQVIYAPSRLTSVTIDYETKWARELTAATGIPVVKVVVTQRNNRRFSDRFAFVGKDRDSDWFVELGFDWVGEELSSGSDVAYTETILTKDDTFDTATLTSKAHPHRFFTYIPKNGILVTSSGEEVAN